MAVTHYRAYANGDVVHEGKTTGGKAAFSTKEKIAKVVFYSGTKAEEVVAGSVNLNGATGKIDAGLPEA